jgi:hypothetical protein
MDKAAFNQKKNLLTSKLELYLRKELVKFYIYSIAFYGVESCTLRQIDENTLEVPKCDAREGQ